MSRKSKKHSIARRSCPAEPISTANDVEERMTLLRDQIDSLQVAVSEKKKPWYRNSSTLLSVLALTISTIFGLDAIYQKVIADKYAKREQIRDLMSRLLDLDHDYYTRDALLQDKELLDDAETAINSKKSLYLENIQRLEGELRMPLTFNEYDELASQATSVHDPELAEEYYMKAHAQASTRKERMRIDQYLGSFYFAGGAFINPDKARKYFSEALATATQGDGDSPEYDSAMVLGTWANAARGNKSFTEAYSKMSAALDEITKIPDGKRLRTIGIENLQERIDDWRKEGETFYSAPELRSKLEQVGIKLTHYKYKKEQ